MPNRLLKEGICTSDSINSLSSDAEVLFYRLLVVSDDYGRMDARIPIIKSQCFPLKDSFDSEKISNCLQELIDNNLCRLYEVEKKRYLLINKWEQRQRSKEKYPQPIDDIKHDVVICQQVAVNSQTSDGLGLGLGLGLGEGKGKGDTKESKKENPFLLPDWINQSDWDMWMKTRKGKKMIPLQMMKQVHKLQVWKESGQDYAGALEAAAINGYTGLYLPDNKASPKKPVKFNASEYLQGHGDGYGNPTKGNENGIIEINPKFLA